MPNAKLYHDGEEITVSDAADIAREIVDFGGIDAADMVSIFRRALSCRYSEDSGRNVFDADGIDDSEDARVEFYSLTEIEIIPDFG
jgi:hypothetical protein